MVLLSSKTFIFKRISITGLIPKMVRIYSSDFICPIGLRGRQVWAARHPEEHSSLIWFTVWSSAVHGAIMTLQVLSDHNEHGHLVGDIPALVLSARVLAILTPRRASASAQGRVTAP